MEKYIAIDNIDSYYEQVVKRKMSPATVTKLVVSLGIVLTVFIVAVILMVTVADWLFFIVLTMFGLGAYLVYYILKHSRVEYEYTFVLGELRIARIKGNAKRRTITYFDVKNIDDIGHYINAETGKRTIDPSKYPNLLHAAEDDYALDTYYFIIHDKVRKKPAVLLMTPNEKTFSMIRPYLSVELKKKFLKMQKEAGLRLQTEEDNRPTDTQENVAEETKSEETKAEETKAEETKSDVPPVSLKKPPQQKTQNGSSQPKNNRSGKAGNGQRKNPNKSQKQNHSKPSAKKGTSSKA